MSPVISNKMLLGSMCRMGWRGPGVQTSTGTWPTGVLHWCQNLSLAMLLQKGNKAASGELVGPQGFLRGEATLGPFWAVCGKGQRAACHL